MLSHEASIIATKEMAEMKMIEFFIRRKLSLTALGIQSQSAVSPKAHRNGRLAYWRLSSHSAINLHSSAPCEAAVGFIKWVDGFIRHSSIE